MPAFELHTNGFPGIAASAIAMGAVVGLDVGDVQRQVLPLATVNAEPHGIALASAVNPGDGIPVINRIGDVIKVTAIASLGHGADVGIASTNGGLGPITGASGVVKWRVGRAVTAAAASEVFSLYVSPRELGGLA